MSAFFYGYILSQIPGGSLGRRFGHKRVLTWAASGWAILTLLTVPAAGTSFRALLACRFALGLVEGATYPCVYGYLQPFLLYGTFGPDFYHFDCFELDVRGHL